MIRRWIHGHHSQVKEAQTKRMPWIRRARVKGQRRWLESSTTFADGFIDLVIAGCVEQPGLPPIMGVACEHWDQDLPGETTDKIDLTVYYYGALEFFTDSALIPAEPAVPLNLREEVVPTPKWILPEREEESDEEE
jgi:hypothetical protein